MRFTVRQRWAMLLASLAFIGLMIAVAPGQVADFVRALGTIWQEQPK